MTTFPLPLAWLDSAIVLAILGALAVSPLRDAVRAWYCGLLFTGATFACTVLACLEFYAFAAPGGDTPSSLQSYLFGRQLFRIDELNAPLIPLVALVHLLTALATGRTKMRRFSLRFSLASEAIRLAMFGCVAPGVLIGLMILGPVPAYLELVDRRKPTRVYLLHMALFAVLLVLGWALVDPGADAHSLSAWASIPLLAAILVRCGTVPAHGWLTDWFENASFGNALLFVTPLVGVNAAVRLVLPIAPDWVLQSIGLVSLLTAVYAACMALVQQEARRFFAYLFLSHASLVLVGLELHTAVSLTGALALWMSVTLSMAGFGLTLRALEARFGRLSLSGFCGLYDHSPALAICFALTGLASAGFPGTLGFVATELLVKGAVQTNLAVGLLVALAAAINGIAVVRVYFLLFSGARHASTVSLGINPRERLAVLVLAAVILGGGLVPQPGIVSRYHAAGAVLRMRAASFGSPASESQHPGPSATRDHSFGQTPLDI